jgi:phosphoribosylaminoimidazolecarboxamide formyltransferase/IMP cyclohydrolase
MMDGRVKTLHPKVHGGLLAVRDNPEHAAAMKAHGIEPIDLVCINLYPFEKTVARPGVTLEEAIENIDIGGPSMVRSAAKNNHYVLVLTSADQYAGVLAELRANKGRTTQPSRMRHAQAAFARTSAYDGAIQAYLKGQIGDGPSPAGEAQSLPPGIDIHLTRKQSLRYGENPHQKGALYVEGSSSPEPSVAFAKQHHGKELSYINLLDADGALSAVREFGEAAACIVKHATPCGCAVAGDLPTAFTRAFEGDPLAAFGGIVALNREVDLATATAITSIDKLLEVIVAPSYTADALELLKSRWKNVRLLEVGPLGAPAGGSFHMHKIVGGYLVQERDLLGADQPNWKVVSKRQPTVAEWDDLKFAWVVCKHVKSNAITIARQRMLVGAGAGQQDRVGAARIAIEKAAERVKGAVAASDAFFPFADGPELLLKAGVTAIIHPGGSLKDADSIAAADKHGAVMVFTGQRHFRH